jgi:hypothetical protein
MLTLSSNVFHFLKCISYIYIYIYIKHEIVIPHSNARFIFSRSFPISRGNLTQWRPLLPKGGGMVEVDLGGQPSFPLNQHFEPMVLINHDIDPFDGEFNVISSSFVNCKHHVMILCTFIQHSVNALDLIKTLQLSALGLE